MSKIKLLKPFPLHIKPAPVSSQVSAFSTNRNSNFFFSCSGPKPWSQTLTPYYHPLCSPVIKSTLPSKYVSNLMTHPCFQHHYNLSSSTIIPHLDYCTGFLTHLLTSILDPTTVYFSDHSQSHP